MALKVKNLFFTFVLFLKNIRKKTKTFVKTYYYYYMKGEKNFNNNLIKRQLKWMII